MKIVREKSGGNGRFLGWTVLISVALLAGGILLGDTLRAAGQPAWNRLTRQLNTNHAADLPTLFIDMDFERYNQLLQQRQEALDSGVFIGGDGDFVPADVTLDSETIRVQMRLQQGPAAHLGPDDKWNFEIRADDDQPLRGMTRAQLIDPADNNWLNEWGYQQALRQAGILATPYTFVELVFNGDARGIYALQGGFDANLPVTQGQAPGVIVEFDPTLIWQNIAYFGGDSEAARADPVTNFNRGGVQFLEVDTFRDAAVARDEVLSAQKETAIEKLRAFQRGQLPAGELFNLETTAKFLAISDLWGAADAASLLNLRFYYDAANGRLEPIGFNGNPQLENGRVDIPAATFNDPALQAATIKAMQTVAAPDYLTDLQASLNDEWAVWQSILAAEADIASPWRGLTEQQANIRRSLQPQQPIFANYVAAENTPPDIFQVEISSVVNLPVEIVGLDFGSGTYLPGDSAWVADGADFLLQPAAQPLVIQPFTDRMPLIRLEIPLTQIYGANPNDDTLNANDTQIEARIWGTKNSVFVPVRPGFAAGAAIDSP